MLSVSVGQVTNGNCRLLCVTLTGHAGPCTRVACGHYLRECLDWQRKNPVQ